MATFYLASGTPVIGSVGKVCASIYALCAHARAQLHALMEHLSITVPHFYLDSMKEK